MSKLEKIDYMIQCLCIAKEELEYKMRYENERPSYSDSPGTFISFLQTHRNPKKALIRENLQNVARVARILVKEIK